MNGILCIETNLSLILWAPKYTIGISNRWCNLQPFFTKNGRQIINCTDFIWLTTHLVTWVEIIGFPKESTKTLIIVGYLQFWWQCFENELQVFYIAYSSIAFNFIHKYTKEACLNFSLPFLMYISKSFCTSFWITKLFSPFENNYRKLNDSNFIWAVMKLEKKKLKRGQLSNALINKNNG